MSDQNGYMEGDDWDNAEWEHAATDSHVLMWQAQIAHDITHVPIGQAPPPVDAAKNDGRMPVLDIEFKPRKDRYMVITKIAPGGPEDAKNAIMSGDILVAVNGTPIRGLRRAEIAPLIQCPPPLLLTLAAEFKVGGDYVACHTLFNGDRVQVSRLGGVVKSLEPSEGLVTPRARHSDGDAPPVTPRSSIQAAVTASSPALCVDYVDYASLRTPRSTVTTPQDPSGAPQQQQQAADRLGLTPIQGSPQHPSGATRNVMLTPTSPAGGGGLHPSLMGSPTTPTHLPAAPGMQSPAAPPRAHSMPTTPVGTPSPKAPKSAPRRALSSMGKMAKALKSKMTPRGHKKDKNNSQSPEQNSSENTSPVQQQQQQQEQ